MSRSSSPSRKCWLPGRSSPRPARSTAPGMWPSRLVVALVAAVLGRRPRVEEHHVRRAEERADVGRREAQPRLGPRRERGLAAAARRAFEIGPVLLDPGAGSRRRGSAPTRGRRPAGSTRPGRRRATGVVVEHDRRAVADAGRGQRAGDLLRAGQEQARRRSRRGRSGRSASRGGPRPGCGRRRGPPGRCRRAASGRRGSGPPAGRACRPASRSRRAAPAGRGRSSAGCGRWSRRSAGRGRHRRYHTGRGLALPARRREGRRGPRRRCRPLGAGIYLNTGSAGPLPAETAAAMAELAELRAPRSAARRVPTTATTSSSGWPRRARRVAAILGADVDDGRAHPLDDRRR